jgi:calcium binding protein 39
MNIFFHGKKQKNPAELVKSLKETLQAVAANPKNLEKVSDDISKNIAAMKFVLYGDNEHEPNPDTCGILANEIYLADLLPLLVANVAKLEFEAKKDLTTVFNNLLRRQVAARYPTVEYIVRNQEILDNLVKGYENTDIALTCGAILRECIKHEPLAKIILSSDRFWDFFKYVEVANFDVASDAFATFKELLTKHKTYSAEFLEKNYDRVFEKYTSLLNSPNYVTRRQSLKLLGELLLDNNRSNFNIMTKYISSSSNLKLMMNLLRDKSRSIQYEAFHVFKIFVANPNKTKPVLEILQKNKDRLIAFLTQFHTDKEEEQFNDEKTFLLKQIQAIPSE